MKIAKVPYSDGSLDANRGCETAPDAILEQLKNVWATEDHRPFTISKHEIIDTKVRNTMQYDELMAKITQTHADIYLGGDHSITFAIAKAFAANHKNAGLLVFDAHPECYEQFSHPTHGDWLFHLVKQSIIPPQNIILVGVRATDVKEVAFLKAQGIRCFWMKDLFSNHQYACDAIMEAARQFDALHLSIDIDVLDPSCAPATGFPEPGGLTTRELLYYLQRIRKLKNLRQFDITEVNPTRDTNSITAKAAARLLVEVPPEHWVL